jgi:hypothetical protein
LINPFCADIGDRFREAAALYSASTLVAILSPKMTITFKTARRKIDLQRGKSAGLII